MRAKDAFSYICNQCGRCCHDKVITLSPYDVLRMARANGLGTSETIARYTLRRGSLLKFGTDGACIALEGVRCGLHRGRPLACRLYPLGMERAPSGELEFVKLEPAAGSAGVYGNESTVAAFLNSQGMPEHLAQQERYRLLLTVFRDRIVALIDFAQVEPREFWRRAFREAMSESNFDPNPIVEALYDPDGHGCSRARDEDTVSAHIERIKQLCADQADGFVLAVAAMLLAVSLGYSPQEVAGPI